MRGPGTRAGAAAGHTEVIAAAKIEPDVCLHNTYTIVPEVLVGGAPY